MSNLENNETFMYTIGDVIHHKHYGYRGVIYHCDISCIADEQWYHSNQTQPGRDQPWYGVLVDGATHTTYVAQSNLEADITGAPINHPDLNKMFLSFLDGHYYQECLN